jgi:Ca-activated chloride channel family protein
MRRKSVKLLLTTLLVASTLPVLRAAADRDLLVSVLDAKKDPVSDLAPADLVVREDGVAREVLRVRQATSPLTIALLIDDSAAASSAIADIRLGLAAFFDALDPKAEVALITFGDRPTVLVEYTRDRERLKRAVQRLHERSGAGAYFLDAVVDASRGLEKRAPERPVIVSVMTEGVEFSTLTYEPVLRRLYASGAQLHALVLSGEVQANAAADEIRNRNIVLDEGTRGTGGRRDQLLSSIAVGAVLKELAAELEHQWIVTYARPDSLIPPERVQVEAKRPGLTVRARTTLAAPSTKALP